MVFVIKLKIHMLQYTMIIGIAIEIPFALGEMILGLEVNLYKYKASYNLGFYFVLLILK